MNTQNQWAAQLKKEKHLQKAIGTISVEQELAQLSNHIEYQKIKLKQAAEAQDIPNLEAIRSVLIALRGKQTEQELIAEKQVYTTVSSDTRERILRNFYIDVAKLIRYTRRLSNN